MIVKHLYTPGLSVNTYLIFDESTRKGAVIDPTMATRNIIAYASENNVIITDIIETHVHADFVSGAPSLKAALSGTPIIHCSSMGGKQWIPHYADRSVADGDEVVIDSLRLRALHTPGHTPEHLVWVAYDDKRTKQMPQLLFSGDLLFVGSVGRPDLLGKELEVELSRQLYASLFEVLSALPDHLEVYPAHGAGSPCGKEIGTSAHTTLGYEQRCNKWLQAKPFDQWHKELMQDAPAIPKYYTRMKRLNITGSHASLQTLQELSLPETMALAASHLIVDLRNYDLFAHGHIPGSLNIPYLPGLPLWAGSILPHDKPIICVADSLQMCLKTSELLQLVGITQVSAWCDATLWNPHVHLLEKFKLIEPEDLLKRKDDYFVLDVRSHHEWNAEHLPHAHHIELADVPAALKTLPRDQTIAVICRSGNRASIAASLLAQEGFKKTCNVRGGMTGFKNHL